MPSHPGLWSQWCYADADESFKEAIACGDQARLRTWCRAHPDKLRLALDWLFLQHKEYRQIIQLELEDVRRAEEERKYKEIHGKITALEKPHWTTTPVFWVGVVALILAGLAAWFAWLAIPVSERPYFHLPASPQRSSLSTPPPAASPSSPPKAS